MRPPRYYDQDFMAQRGGRINGVPLYETSAFLLERHLYSSVCPRSLVSRNIPSINLVSKEISHRIDGNASFKFGQRLLVLAGGI